jgi:predicted methyltransferase
MVRRLSALHVAPMNHIPLIACVASLAACSARPAEPPVNTRPIVDTGAATVATPTTPDPALVAAIRGPARTDKERARDGARHPLETLTFFAVRADAHVVELWPGGGWYTAILAPYLRDRGQLALTHFDPAGNPENEDTQEAKAILARLDHAPDAFGKVVRLPIAPPRISLGPDGSADVVLTFRNVHNWITAGYDAQVFQAIARVLKRGGVLGVEEHRAIGDATDKQIGDTGYVPEARVVRLAEAAGLVLEARAEINANPRDTRDHANGVWSLPPTFAGKDVDRDRYAAIGESDRMTLRFRKP